MIVTTKHMTHDRDSDFSRILLIVIYSITSLLDLKNKVFICKIWISLLLLLFFAGLALAFYFQFQSFYVHYSHCHVWFFSHINQNANTWVSFHFGGASLYFLNLKLFFTLHFFPSLVWVLGDVFSSLSFFERNVLLINWN